MQDSLSIKELRAHLPSVLKKIEKGKKYTLIYRSRPVGQIGPLEDSSPDSSRVAPLRFFTEGHSLKVKSKKSAVQLIREERKR